MVPPPPPEEVVELIVIVLLIASVEMVILLPGTIDNVSVGVDARIKELFALIVANEFVTEPVAILAIEPLACL